MFSPERGGVVCAACQTPGEQYIPLSRSDVNILSTLQKASLSEATGLSIKYGDAIRLIEAVLALARFQTGSMTEMKTLSFLKQLSDQQKTEKKIKRKS
jgi:hypothetical protein